MATPSLLVGAPLSSFGTVGVPVVGTARSLAGTLADERCTRVVSLVVMHAIINVRTSIVGLDVGLAVLVVAALIGSPSRCRLVGASLVG